MFKAGFVLGALKQSFSGAFLKQRHGSSGFSPSQFGPFLQLMAKLMFGNRHAPAKDIND